MRGREGCYTLELSNRGAPGMRTLMYLSKCVAKQLVSVYVCLKVRVMGYVGKGWKRGWFSWIFVDQLVLYVYTRFYCTVLYE